MMLPSQAFLFLVLSPHWLSHCLFIVAFLYLMDLALSCHEIAKQKHKC